MHDIHQILIWSIVGFPCTLKETHSSNKNHFPNDGVSHPLKSDPPQILEAQLSTNTHDFDLAKVVLYDLSVLKPRFNDSMSIGVAKIGTTPERENTTKKWWVCRNLMKFIIFLIGKCSFTDLGWFIAVWVYRNVICPMIQGLHFEGPERVWWLQTASIGRSKCIPHNSFATEDSCRFLGQQKAKAHMPEVLSQRFIEIHHCSSDLYHLKCHWCWATGGSLQNSQRR